MASEYDPADLIRVSEIAKYLRDDCRMAKPPTRQTIWNWMTRGIQTGATTKDRLYLEAVKVGGRLHSTRRWVDEFLAELDTVRA